MSQQLRLKPWVGLTWSCLILSCHGYRVIPTAGLTHGRLIGGSVSYLASLLDQNATLSDTNESQTENKLTPILSNLQSNPTLLVQGQIDADYDGGNLQVLNNIIQRNSITHFHNPATGEGYRAAARLRWVAWLESTGWLHPLLSQIRGPGMSAADMADWYYARALYYYASDDPTQNADADNAEESTSHRNVTEALRSLSFATHLIQDATVPQHASDCGEEDSSCQHSFYEKFVDDNYAQWSPPNASLAQLQQWAGNMTAGDMVRFVANRAYPLLEQASATEEVDQRMGTVADQMIPFAQEVGAALLLKFMLQVSATPSITATFTTTTTDTTPTGEVLLFQIQSASLRGKLKERRADLRPLVWFQDQDPSTEGQLRGWFQDSRELRPQEGLDAFGWTFVYPLTEEDVSRGFVTAHLEMQEVHADWCGDMCGAVQKRMILAPEGSTVLDVTFDLSDAKVDLVQGTSDGCDAEQSTIDNCKNTMAVSYVLGRSYAVSGVYKQFVVCGNSMTRRGVIAISLMGVAVFVVVMGGILLFYKCLAKRVRRGKHAKMWH